MSLIKSSEEIKILREGGKRLAAILKILEKEAGPGRPVVELEEIAIREIEKAGAAPAFKGYKPNSHALAYPAALCASINEEVVHCAPKRGRVLNDGDILSLDLGIQYQGLFTDSAVTVPVGSVAPELKRLLDGTREALSAGIAEARIGKTIGDISAAIENIGKKYGFGVIRDLVGHGVGHGIHEPPSIPNYGKAGQGEKLRAGMVLAIEPMFTLGGWQIDFAGDGWTVVTRDGSFSAHFEHTVLISSAGPEIITK